MTNAALRMGTRASALARAQSGAAAAALTRATGRAIEVVIIRTEGDRLSSEGKAPPGGDNTGVFTRALDEALRDGRIDFAVHSLKDLPTSEEPGLSLAAVPERADPRDALVLPPGVGADAADPFAGLALGARVATSSPRRVAQLLALRPDLIPTAMAGNVDTRLRRLAAGDVEALLLACAGLDRLGLGERIAARLARGTFLGAPGQGALAMVCREDDRDTSAALATQDHEASRAEVTAERSFLNALRGGCRAPVGAAACLVRDPLALELRGCVLSLDGRTRLSRTASVSWTGGSANSGARLQDAVALGRRLAEACLAEGAADLIGAAREATTR